MQALANDSSLCRFSTADWRCRFTRLYLALFLCETLFSSSEKIKSNFTGQAEDRKIDPGNELHNLRLCEKEKISDYIARERGLATKCASLGLDVTERELAFYVVRMLTGKYAKIREILKTQREKSIDDLLEILREEETLQNNVGMPTEVSIPDLAFTAVRRQRQKRVCYFCRKPNHVMKDCFIR
ncbi:hypothetical protein AVEN_19003-1 [Araneus ventricosus]|uniref:CCHC-type domain-containing protein n=1 Tax=Araneus ventricosus TaxID=182803 RepID=A0A4Y2KKX5_ARAVE|nr:hypothetical protein AVEN_19003-1 [Araneus ventricosus]